MSTAKLTGYLAAAATMAWSSGQALANLTNNEWTNLTDALDNSSDLAIFESLELVLASAAFTGAGSTILVYLVPSVDGTNYPNWTGDVTTEEPENEQYLVGQFDTSQATEAQRVAWRNIRLPNGLYKYGFRNKSGVTLASSGNTVK